MPILLATEIENTVCYIGVDIDDALARRADEVWPRLDLAVGILGQADRARRGDALQARGDIRSFY
ncbi:hypothetical protein [Rhizobium etli]|uniref:hypothetical protein n=1 Tax=Rhizobium etli TaxID=29449 RepID=UPI00058A3264|nr:hypothetical protein [Rhizobium sp. IE4771]